MRIAYNWFPRLNAAFTPAQNFDFLPRNGAFYVHSDMIKQFKTPVLIRLKPAKSSDIVTKVSKVVVILRIRNLVMTSANYFDN